MPVLLSAICCIPAPRNGSLRHIAIKASSIEYKPSCALTDTPTFCMIEPAANKSLSDHEWHGFSYIHCCSHLP